MFLQPLPSGTTHILNKNGMEFLPPFVRARLNDLSDMLDWREDEGEEEDTHFCRGIWLAVCLYHSLLYYGRKKIIRFQYGVFFGERTRVCFIQIRW